MPLPTLKKTWQFSHYVGVPSGVFNIDQANAFVAAKDAMKAYGSSPWTVVGSSDGTTGALDAVDRWTSGSVVSLAVTHAWILLEQAGWNGGGQVCWRWLNGGQIEMWSSPLGAFSGGTGTTRPTASDEQNTAQGQVIYNPYPGSGSGVFAIHSMMSTDGQCTRFFLGANNVYGNAYAWETFDEPTGNIDNPVFSTVVSWGAFPDFRDTPACMTGNAGQTLYPSNTLVPFLEAVGNGNFQIDQLNGPNEISHLHPFYDYCMGVTLDRTGGPHQIFRGIYGRVFDLWFTDSTPSTGDGFPSDGSKQFICTSVTQGFFQSTVVWPWDGTTLVMG